MRSSPLEHTISRRLPLALAILTVCACSGSDDSPITGAAITELRRIDQGGDLWASAWADDGSLFLSWGDGTGRGECYPVRVGAPIPAECSTIASDSCDNPGAPIVFCEDFCDAFPCDGQTCYPPCEITQAGVMQSQTPIGIFEACEACIRSVHVPTGVPQFLQGEDEWSRRGDKPSSMLSINGTLYFAGHYNAGLPTLGYIAVSEDNGATWAEIPDSPWDASTNLRVMMFIAAGKAQSLATEYVYALAIENERETPIDGQQVYLARVPITAITDYSAYTYYGGGGETPSWTSSPHDAQPVNGLRAGSQGGAMYHTGTQRYVFLTVTSKPNVLTLFDAAQPWGPWQETQRFAEHLYTPGIIAKDAGTSSFYFTASNGSGIEGAPVPNLLNIGKIELTTD